MKAAWCVAMIAVALGQSTAGKPSLVLRQTISLPDVEGRIDHLAFDSAHAQIFVAALGHNTVEVVDVAKGVRARSLSGFDEPQGIAVLPEFGLVAVANGRSGNLVLLDAAGGTLKRTIALTEDADNVRWDGQAKLLYVGHGSGAISALDPATGRVAGEVRLPGHPESFQLERAGSRMYANVPDAGIVAVIDRKAMKLESTWPVSGAKANYPMALDEEGHRLFIGCRQPARMLVYDTRSGKQIAAFDMCGDTDDVFFDAARKRLYVSCGAGFLDVFEEQDGSRFARTAHLVTAAGARTSLYVPDQHRLYLAVPHRGAQRAEIRAYDVTD